MNNTSRRKQHEHDDNVAAAAFASIAPASAARLSATIMDVLSETDKHAIAGTVARTVAQATIHPVDTIKTRLQIAQPSRSRIAVSLGGSQIKAPRVPSINLDNSIQPPAAAASRVGLSLHIPRVARKAYVGLTGAILGSCTSSFVYFVTYEKVRALLEQVLPGGQLPGIKHILCASAGALTSAVVRVPSDVIKHRVQANMYPNIKVAAASIFRTEGIKGLYSGFGATLLRDIPDIAIQFALYEHLKHTALGLAKGNLQVDETGELHPSGHMAVGGASGALAAIVTMPLDTLKTRVQVSSTSGARPVAAKVLAQIVAEQGIAGLYNGLGPKVLQTALMSAVFFACFECCKAQMRALSAAAPAKQQQQQQRQQPPWQQALHAEVNSSRSAMGSPDRILAGQQQQQQQQQQDQGQSGVLKLALPLSGRTRDISSFAHSRPGETGSCC